MDLIDKDKSKIARGKSIVGLTMIWYIHVVL